MSRTRVLLALALAVAMLGLGGLASPERADAAGGAKVNAGGDWGPGGNADTGGMGGATGVDLFDIHGLDNGITWDTSGCAAARTSYASTGGVNAQQERDCISSVTARLKHPSRSEGAALLCDIWNPWPQFGSIAYAPPGPWPGRPCLGQTEHTGNLSLYDGPGSNDEMHQNIEFLRSGGAAGTRDMTRGTPVAWIIRVWRNKIFGPVDLPLYGRAGDMNSPNFPVFERRMNLNPGDPRSDAGGGGTPRAIGQSTWWSGGPNGPAPEMDHGNWWLNRAQAGPIGWSQTATVQEECRNRWDDYIKGIDDRGTVPPKLSGKTLRTWVGTPTIRPDRRGGASACLYDWGAANNVWFTDEDNNPLRESITLGWWRTGNDSYARYKIIAPSGYLYVVQVAQVDRAEQIVSSSTRVFFAQATGTPPPPTVVTPPPPVTPGVSVSVTAARSLTTGSRGDADLTATVTSANSPRDQGQIGINQQAWPLATTAYWWNAVQAQDSGWATMGDAGTFIVKETSGRAPDADTTVTASIPNPGNGMGMRSAPGLYQPNEGRMRALTQGVTLTHDGRLPVGNPPAQVPVSVLAQPGHLVSIRRTFDIAQSSADLRVNGSLVPLQMSATATVEKGAWNQTAFTTPNQQDWQQPCDPPRPAIPNPCIEEINPRAQARYTPAAAPAEQLAGAYFTHPVEGYAKVTLHAENPAGVVSLAVHDAAADNGSIKRSLYNGNGIPQYGIDKIIGPRSISPAGPDAWSITYCRSGEAPGAWWARTGGPVTDVPPEQEGDFGCQSDYHYWDWQLKGDVACAAEGRDNPRPDLGHCVRPNPNYVDLCPAGSNTSPAGTYLNTAYGFRTGSQAIRGSNMIEMRGNVSVLSDNEKNTFPWLGPQAPCVIPGRWYQGRWGVKGVPRLTYVCRNTNNDVTATLASSCGGGTAETAVDGVNVNMEFNRIAAGSPCPNGSLNATATGNGCFFPGWGRNELVSIYKSQIVQEANPAFRDTTLYSRYNTGVCLQFSGTGRNRRCTRYKWEFRPYAYRAQFPDTTTATIHGPFNQSNGWGFQTEGTPTPPNAIRTDQSTTRPTEGPDYWLGYTRLGAARGWQYVARQGDCTDNVQGTTTINVRACPVPGPHNVGYRLGTGTGGAGWYFIDGIITPAAGRWGYTVRQFQPQGSRWTWDTTPTVATSPATTSVLGMQPSR